MYGLWNTKITRHAKMQENTINNEEEKKSIMIWLNCFHSESDSTSQVIITIYLGKMIRPSTIICIAQHCPEVIYFTEIYSY